MNHDDSDGINIINFASTEELSNRKTFLELYEGCPIPKNEILSNLGLFIRRQGLARMLYMNDLYKQILDVHGIICEFGVRWGQNMALFESFRGMYEPYNWNRKIVGFDTFEGFPNTHEKDGKSSIIKRGAYAVTSNYADYLSNIIDFHESESPISHIKKYELVKGDATVTIHNYLKENPETIIAFAYFDFDIYEPTKVCLEAIIPHLTKGSIIGFDEINFHDFPGETLALKEVFGLSKYKIRRSTFNSKESYIIIE